VLVVEDNTTNQMVATGLLSKLGYQPEVVSDGRQAVEAVRRNRYLAVLMDCNMPVMDGFEATLAIRAGEGGAGRVPIVAMTAGAMVGDRDRCLAVGMDDYVSKPVKLAELERALSPWAPVADSPGPPGVIDGDQLDTLRLLDGGDGAFLASLVDSFLASADDAVPTLAAAVEAGDVGALAREAHRFKGEAATLGANGLAVLCGGLESLELPRDRLVASGILARIQVEMSRVRDTLHVTSRGAHAPS